MQSAQDLGRGRGVVVDKGFAGFFGYRAGVDALTALGIFSSVSVSNRLLFGCWAQPASKAAAKLCKESASKIWLPDLATEKPKSHIMMVFALSVSLRAKSACLDANDPHSRL